MEFLLKKAKEFKTLGEGLEWADKRQKEREEKEGEYQRKKREGTLTPEETKEREAEVKQRKKVAKQSKRSSGRGRVVKHVKRSKKGKLYNVTEHSRKSASKQVSKIKSKQKATKSAKGKLKNLTDMVRSRVSTKKQANVILDKYLGEGKKHYPSNVKVMIDGKWKNEWRKKSRIVDGKRVEESVMERRYVASPKEWEALLNENKGLVHKIVARYGFNRDLHDDMKQEAYRAIFDGINNYELKFNPADPVDLTKHLSSYIAGYVNAELGKQMATRVALPMHKRKILSKYKEAQIQHGNDYESIYNDLQLMKSDLYPSIDTSEDGLLPREGYVTTRKGEKIDRDIAKYEDEVKKQHAKHEDKKNNLLLRREYGMDEANKQVYLDGLDEYDKKIAEKKRDIRDSSKKRKESGTAERKEIRQEIEDIENKKQAYVESFKPIDDEEYGGELTLLENQNQAELRDLRDTHDKKVSKTTISGAFPLFREFDEIESFSYFNVSDTKMGEGGEALNLEQFIVGSTQLTPVEEIEVTTEFVLARDRFMSYFENMDEKTAKVLKLHLGADKDNELYAHGLWGVPMEKNTEIARELPKGFYKKESIDLKEYQKRQKRWKEKKPLERVKTKKSPERVKKETRAWKQRRKGALRAYKKLIVGKDLSVPQKKVLRDNLYKKTKSGWDVKPQVFTEKKLTPAQYELAMLNWKATKPIKELSQKSITDRIGTDLEVGKRILARTMPKVVMQQFLHAYAEAKSGGQRILDAVQHAQQRGKIVIKGLIRDMALISKAVGYAPIYETPVQKGLVTRIVDTIKNMVSKLIGK